MFKRFPLVILLLAVSAVAEPVTIGVSLPLTGDASVYGSDVRRILELANAEIAGGKYKLIFEDDKCNGQSAVSIAQKLINIDKVKYVLGPACSGAMLATAPVYERAKVVVIGQGSAPSIAKAGAYIFRSFPNDQLSGTTLAEYVAARHTHVAVLTEDTEYCHGLSDAFAERIGTAIRLTSETYLPSEIDLRTVLSKLKASQADAVFFNTQAERGFLTAVKQFHDVGGSAAVYGAYWASSPSFLDGAGPLSENIVLVDLPYVSGTLNSRGNELYKKYVAQHGKIQSTEFIFATSMAGFEALHQSIESGADVKEYLLTHTFSGVIDSFSFNQDGDIQGIAPVMKRITNGRAVPIEAASAETGAR